MLAEKLKQNGCNHSLEPPVGGNGRNPSLSPGRARVCHNSASTESMGVDSQFREIGGEQK